MTLDLAAVAASSPFAQVASAEALADELLHPGARPELAPHAERLLLELPAQIVLGFCQRRGIPASALRAAYLWHAARSHGLRNLALEAALDGVA